MHRRKLLGSLGTVATVVLAGCSGNLEAESSSNGEENEPTPNGEANGGSVQETPEQTVEAFLTSIADGDLEAYNEVVHEFAEADSMDEVLSFHGAFFVNFEEEPDELTINSIEVAELEESDVETLVRDILEGEEEDDIEESIQQGTSEIEDITEEYGFTDTAIIYSNYLANDVDIEDYLLVVETEAEWSVFGSLIY